MGLAPALATGVALLTGGLAGGGVLGRPVEFAEGDTLHPEAEARRLIEEEGVHAIVGPNSSADSLLVIEVAAPADVLVISPSASSPLLTRHADRDLFFRTALSDVAQGPALARLTRERGFDNVGVIYRDDAWGRGLAEAFGHAWTGDAVLVVSPTALRESYRDLLEESARGGAQALVLLTFWPEAEVILPEALASGLYDQFVFGDALRRAELAAAVGGGRLAGMYGTGSGPAHDTPSAVAWDTAFRNAYGEGTTASYVKETYDAAIAVMLAAEAAGRAGGLAIRDGIRDAHHLLWALAIEAAAFGADLGADPLTPELQAAADRQRTDLAACIETIDLDPPVALTEPSDAYVAAIAARCRPAEDAAAES